MKKTDRWRIRRFAALSLARAVGHVLDTVDEVNSAIREAARAAHRLRTSDAPEHAKSREFIERERKTTLKKYEFKHHPLGLKADVLGMDASQVVLIIQSLAGPIFCKSMQPNTNSEIWRDMYKPDGDGMKYTSNCAQTRGSLLISFEVVWR